MARAEAAPNPSPAPAGAAAAPGEPGRPGRWPMPQMFPFSVRDEKVAADINRQLGERVVLSYEQHLGLSGCFGETEYFVTGVRRVQP